MTDVITKFKAADAAYLPAFTAWRDAARQLLEAVIADVMASYDLSSWSFGAGDGYNDEGRSWLEFSHELETYQEGARYLTNSSACSFSNVLSMLRECEVKEVTPQTIATGPIKAALNDLTSDPRFLFYAERDREGNVKIAWR